MKFTVSEHFVCVTTWPARVNVNVWLVNLKILFIGLFIIFLEATFIRELYHNRQCLYQISTYIFLIPICQFHIFLSYIATLGFAHVCALFSALYLSITAIIFIKMNQVNRLLYINQRWFTVLQFNRFVKLHTKTLLTIFDINLVFGKINNKFNKKDL